MSELKRGVGFQDKYRLIMNIFGLDGVGKTHFAFTAPQPIGYINTDEGLEGVVEQFEELVDFHYNDYQFDKVSLQPAGAQQLLNRAIAGLEEVVKGNFRTGVIDRWDLFVQLHRYGRTGKWKPPKWSYQKLDAELNSLINGFYRAGKNLILISSAREHRVDRLVDGNIESVWLGGYLPMGWKYTPGKVQVVGELVREGKKRHLRVQKCRPDDSLVGDSFEDARFMDFVEEIWPDIDPEKEFGPMYRS